MILWIAIMIAGQIGMFNSLSSSGVSFPYFVGVTLLFIGAVGALISHRKIKDRITYLECKVEMIRKEQTNEMQSTTYKPQDAERD